MNAPKRRMLARIQSRLIIAFMTVTIIPVVVLSIYGSHSHLKALEQLAFDGAADEAILRSSKLQNGLDRAQSDLLYLSQIPSLNALIEARRQPEGVDVEYVRDKLVKQFETFVASRKGYGAATYLDSEGQEVVRVTRLGATASVVPMTEPTTQPARRPALLRRDGLLAGQMMTEVDTLGTVQVVRFVTRLFPRGMQHRGFVVLETSLTSLWQEEELRDTKTRVVVLDEAGRAIFGDASDLSPSLLQAVTAEARRPVETEEGRIVTYVPIYPRGTHASARWMFVGIERSTVVFRALYRYRRVYTLVLLATLAGAAGLSVVLARQFTVPLERLYDAARDIGHGRFDVELEDRTGDEIGGLAMALRVMADQLKTKHDDMQQQIDEKTRELLQAERLSTIGTMSAAIAHEVNNPLGIISMYSQMLLEHVPEDDPRSEKLRMIAREASRMSAMVRGLLQFTRRSELNIQPVELAGLVEEAVEAGVSQHDRMEGIRVQTAVADDCPPIEADADQLMQVLRNLVVNALHALGDGGEVTISAAADGKEHVRIEVADTGRGIEPENLPRLFEPFFSTRRFGAGTGLGLAISKEIVERHGGEISVSSVVSEGTTFMIRLPLEAKAPREANEKPHT